MTQPEFGLSALFAPAEGSRRLRVAEVLDSAEDRGLGLGLFVTSFPAIVPFLPPGASMVVGILVIIVAVQMLAGAHRLWLPARIRNFVFTEKASESLLLKVRTWERRLARISRPRLPGMTGRTATVLVTLPIIGNGLILFLPLPFLNTLPALAIMAIGIGFVNRDGLLVLVGSLVCTALIAVVAATPGLLLRGLHTVGL